MKVRVVFSCMLMGTAALAFEVPLTVEEPLGAERKIEVVSGGIPLPEGKFKDPAAFGLFDGATEVPVQVSPIVRYPDGSLHWALVSFPVEAAAKSKKTYTLKDTAGKAVPKNPVVVKEAGDLVEVSNGLVGFTVNKANFNGFESVKYAGKEVFKAAKAGLVANDKGGAAKPVYFDFARRGAVETTLYVKGTYGDQKTPTFAMTITLKANESAIHISHNLRNGGIGVKGTSVNAPQICLGTVGELKPAAEGKPLTTAKNYGGREFSGPADLLVFMRHGGTAHMAGKDLVMNHDPVVKGDELSIELSMMKAVPVKMEEGEHKLTEISLVFGRTISVEALAEPLHALAPCDYYSANDGMGVGRGFGSLADETEVYRKAGWTKFDDPKKMPHMKTAPDLRINWLDVHATSECDQIQGMLFGYLRTGERGYLDQATAWQRYYRTYYMYRTDEFTFGKEGRRGGMEKFGAGRTCGGGCHTYGVGIFNYALLTGNVDALEAAFDLAEQCNAAAGTYSSIKPGAALGYWGSRGFVRNYLAVARAADVARSKEWDERAIHFINAAHTAADRDQRGFINHGYTSGHLKGSVDDQVKNGSLTIPLESLEKDGTTVEGNTMKNPKYGSWQLHQFGSWPEAMEAEGHMMSYEALSSSADPVVQVAADDAMDMAIVKAELGYNYLFDTVQKAVYYYMYIDYPIPGQASLWKGGRWKDYQPKGTDSWYTKWWPNPQIAGYKLTGDKRMRERTVELLWWGLARDYINAPYVPQGEAPRYANIDGSTKNDWMTPTALAFGVCAHPKKDELAPAAITDLKATAADGKVQISWTAPADEGGGKLQKYQVKWSDLPLDDYPVDEEYWRKNWKDGKVTVTYWNAAVNVAGEPVPQAAGKGETMTLAIPAGKHAYVSVRSFDDSHNRSKMSNVAEIEVK